MSASLPESTSLPVRLRKSLGRLRRRFVRDTYDVFARKVEEQHQDFEAPEGYRFEWATKDAVASCDAYHTELDERERRDGIARLDLDHRAVVAFAGETPVFTMWMNPRNINVPGVIKRRLRPDQVFIYKAYTSPDHRGKKLYKAGMSFVLSWLAQQGHTELVGYAHVKKSISRKGLAALDFDTRGRFDYVSMPGWRHTFVSTTLARNFPEAVPRSGALREHTEPLSPTSA